MKVPTHWLALALAACGGSDPMTTPGPSIVAPLTVQKADEQCPDSENPTTADGAVPLACLERFAAPVEGTGDGGS